MAAQFEERSILKVDRGSQEFLCRLDVPAQLIKPELIGGRRWPAPSARAAPRYFVGRLRDPVRDES
jgi:hypothetical protein